MTEEFLYKSKSLKFLVKPGVFAQYGLDFGSKLLLEEIEMPRKVRVLDLGCGCGVIGLSIAAIYPETEVYLLDSDIRAVRLARENAKINGIKNVRIEIGDAGEDTKNLGEFEVVVSNPPTHQGREVVQQFLEGAESVLKPGGVLYVVVNRMESVMKRLDEIFGSSEKMRRRQGYIVYKAVKR